MSLKTFFQAMMTSVPRVTPAECAARVRSGEALLVDVRTPAEFQAAHAPGTVNIPLAELGERLAEIPRGAPVVVGCASGSRSGMARTMLRRKGYADVHNIGAWTNFGG